MAIQLEWNRNAYLDALIIADKYFSYSENLKKRFLAEIETTSEYLRQYPLQYPLINKTTRRALLRHFPYVIYYRVTKDRIRITGILHTRQNRDRWKNIH